MDINRSSAPSVLTKMFTLFFVGILLNGLSAINALPSSPSQQNVSESTRNICVENAGLGVHANRGISAYCQSVLDPSISPNTFCKPIPPKIEKKRLVNVDSFLSEGVKNMNDQLDIYASKKLKLGRAIFIMGNSRSGKTTLAQILSKNLNNLDVSYSQNGHMSIVENINLIENLNVPSQKLIPDFVVNPENNVAFWDCPSFSDTRDPDLDIAVKYFVQTALDLTTKAKFIFTLSYLAVKKGNDGKELDSLVGNVIHLIKNVSRFKDSIGIVVTQVKRYAEGGQYQTDEQIYDQIYLSVKSYLNTTTEMLKFKVDEHMTETKDNQEITDLKRKVQFIEAVILSENLSTSSKLYFLQIPEKCGPMSEMKSVHNLKKRITELYQTKLIYSPVFSDDFQFLFKSESDTKLIKYFIPKTFVILEKVVTQISNDLESQFKKKFYETEAEGLEFQGQEIVNRTKSIVQKVANIITTNGTKVPGNSTHHTYVSPHIENIYHGIGMNVIECSSISTFYELEYRIEFFIKSVNRFDQISKLFEISAKPIAHIYDLAEFYEYCNKIKHDKLVQYYEQSVLANLTAQRSSSDAQLIEYISKNHLTHNLLSNLPFMSTSTEEERKYLANVIRSVIPQIEIKCEMSSANKGKKHLIFFGTNVMLSSILNKSNWPESCKGEYDVVEVSVLALERVYFDTDIYPRENEKKIRNSNFLGNLSGIEKVEQLQLSVIAPMWIVTRKINIVLDGFKPVDLPKATSGQGYGDNGKNGKIGGTGGNAGSFFGIYTTIMNNEFLHISANGGDGGTGQNGGDGHVGRKGQNARLGDFPGTTKLRGEPRCHPKQFGLVFNSDSGAQDDYWYDLYQQQCIKEQWAFIDYSKMGAAGQTGGNGGDGGEGGMSGSAGIINVIRLGDIDIDRMNGTSDTVKTQNNMGSCGKGGLGGEGGKSGRNGNFYSCTTHVFSIPNDRSWFECKSKMESHVSGINGTNGQQGNGCSKKSVATVPTFQPWRVITDYRTHFFGHNSNMYNDFLKKLDLSEEISNALSVKSFVVEIEKVENKLYELGIQVVSSREQVISRQYYETFLDRLKNYTAKYVLGNSMSTEEKLALNMVFSNVLGKLVATRRSNYQLNVIKTKEYFDSLVNQMTELKAKRREKTIGEESNKFKSKLDEKVKEAEKFISKTVNPAIEHAHVELENSNDKLVHEINEYLNAADEDITKKKDLKEKMEAAAFANMIMGVFSFFGSVASMLGPKGKAVGAVIDLGVGIAKSIVPGPQVTEEDYKTIKLPTGFQNSVKGGANDQYFINQMTLLAEQTNFISESAEKGDGNVLKDAKALADSTTKDIEALKNSIEVKNGEVDMYDISTLNDLQNTVTEITGSMDTFSENFDDAIEKMEEENKEGDEESKKLEKVSQKLEKESEGDEKTKLPDNPTKEKDAGLEITDVQIAKGIVNTVKLVKASGTLFNTIVSDKKNLKKMDQAIKDAEQHVKDIETKKTQFYNQVLPVLTSANDQLNKVTSGIAGQSNVALSVKKWKIKGMLKNMRGFIQQFTQTMKVTEVYQRCIDTLDEALLLMIELYDHIERYEEKKEMADFIANVNSANDLSQIDDIELKGGLIKIDFFINANLFLEDYQKGIHAFKQWAFPFANRYLNETKLDNKLSRELPTVISAYTDHVKDLSVALERYGATTRTGDQYSLVSFFTSDGVSTEPFYKWSNEKWKDAIKKLLAGEPIRLKADVNLIDQESFLFFKTKSAIKFKTIGLVLKARDENRQNELNSTLNHFHMEMTHSGISLYKVMDQNFVMYDKSMTYRYSFEKTKDNNHVTVNRVKYKVDGPGSDFLMSPYTWWTFQISKAKAGGLEFEDLKQFENEVDLELEGFGVYLDETRVSTQDLKDLKLADYYEVYDSKTNWGSKEKHKTSTCILTRATNDETESSMGSHSSSNTEQSEWTSFNILFVICITGGVILSSYVAFQFLCSKYFLGYTMVPV